MTKGGGSRPRNHLFPPLPRHILCLPRHAWVARHGLHERLDLVRETPVRRVRDRQCSRFVIVAIPRRLRYLELPEPAVGLQRLSDPTPGAARLGGRGLARVGIRRPGSSTVANNRISSRLPLRVVACLRLHEGEAIFASQALRSSMRVSTELYRGPATP